MASVSSKPMAGDGQDDPLSLHHFGLEIQGLQAGLFTKCSPITSETESKEIHHSGPLGTIYKQVVPGHYKVDQKVTLTRGITRNKALWDWRKLVLEGMYEMARKTVTITGYDQENKPVIQFMLLRAWPAKYTLPSWDASQKDKVAEESVEIVYEGLVRSL